MKPTAFPDHRAKATERMITEVELARARAIDADPAKLNIDERLDLHRGVDHAAANRFPALSQDFRDLLAAHTAQREAFAALTTEYAMRDYDEAGLQELLVKLNAVLNPK